MKNNEYWKNRFEQLEKARHERAKIDLTEIEKIFDESIKQLDKKIEIWYRRIAENNDVSMTEARKMLTKNQLKEFRWDVWEYIKFGQENALDQQWEKELENASAKAHITRLEALKIDSKAAIEELYTQYGEAVKTALSSVYSDTRLTTNYEISKGLNVLFNTSKVNRTTLEAVLSKPWVTDGFNFSERIWNNKEKLIKEIHKELTIDILQGRDPQKAIDSIAKKMNTSKYNAGRLVMTEEAYFASLAQKDELEYLGVEKYEILATLDDRTSDICQNLDGKVFPTKDYEPGTTAPPFHVYCRSTTVPYFDDDYGVKGERAARDPETGETYYVPDNITYPEWKEKFVDKGLTNGDNGGIIKSDRRLDRRESNIGAFESLKIPMQKRNILSICKKYSIDTKGITFKIQRSEKFLSMPFYGSTDYNNIGRIDLFPNAFSSEEELVKTILHEKCHVKQLQKFGKKYAQDNLDMMERQAYRFESIYYYILKRQV